MVSHPAKVKMPEGGLCPSLFTLLTVWAYLLSAKVARIKKKKTIVGRE